MSNESLRDELTEQIITNQKAMFQAMQGVQMPDWLGSDMTMPQFKILFLLYTHGDLRMSEIAKTLDKNISTATGIVDRLVEQHFIRREEDPKDRRVVIARLTHLGQELCESFLQAGWQQAHSMLSHLTLEELQIVAQGMTIMARVATTEAHERIGASIPLLSRSSEQKQP